MSAVVRQLKRDSYRMVEDTKRPFRIWDSQEKREVPHRNYKTERRALDQALLLVRWSKVGVTLEVFDLRHAKHIGTYSRRVSSITFDPPKRVGT
jgi:hypothetical protein